MYLYIIRVVQLLPFNSTIVFNNLLRNSHLIVYPFIININIQISLKAATSNAKDIFDIE